MNTATGTADMQSFRIATSSLGPVGNDSKSACFLPQLDTSSQRRQTSYAETENSTLIR